MLFEEDIQLPVFSKIKTPFFNSINDSAVSDLITFSDGKILVCGATFFHSNSISNHCGVFTYGYEKTLSMQKWRYVY
jgi:hypothetical protein